MAEPALPTDADAVAANGLSADGMIATTRKQARSFKREESWVAHTVDPTAVQRTLTRLWAEVVEERRAAIGRPRREGDAELMRTRTINLIGIADTTEYSDRIHDTVTTLAEFFPSRSVILVRTPPTSLADGLAIKLEVEE